MSLQGFNQSKWRVELALPDTVGGSDHSGLEIGCFRCLAPLMSGNDIYQIKENVIWTRSLMSSTINEGVEFYNEWKKCKAYDAQCGNCGWKVGAIYKEIFFDKDTGEDTTIPLPAVRITTARVNKKSGKRYNDTLLLGREASTRHAVQQLTLASATTDNSHLLKGMIVDPRLYDFVKATKTANQTIETLQIQLLKVTWQCCTDKGWVPYNDRVNAGMESAFQESKKFIFAMKSVTYQVCFDNVTGPFLQERIDGIYTTKRIIRRKEIRDAPWGAEPEVLMNGDVPLPVSKYSISNAKSTSVSRETWELNFALAQFCRMLGVSADKVTQVDCYENPILAKVYAAKKDQIDRDIGGNGGEMWVFHGTADCDIEAIMCGGFKVGGSEGIIVRNGTAHGPGVYTATGPRSPMHYAGKHGAKKVILAQGLTGADFSQPRNDWALFGSGEQLLPKYVVHYDVA